MPSTVIRTLDYRPERREFGVLFTTGRRYIFRDVLPDAAAESRAARIKGRHFNAHIRGQCWFTSCEQGDEMSP